MDVEIKEEEFDIDVNFDYGKDAELEDVTTQIATLTNQLIDVLQRVVEDIDDVVLQRLHDRLRTLRVHFLYHVPIEDSQRRSSQVGAYQRTRSRIKYL